jgi:hypothetical protein
MKSGPRSLNRLRRKQRRLTVVDIENVLGGAIFLPHRPLGFLPHRPIGADAARTPQGDAA